MSYTSNSELPEKIQIHLVLELLDLLGYKLSRSGLKVPNLKREYFWYEENDYRSWTGVELQVYQDKNRISINTRSRSGRSYWDLLHQNRTISLIRNIFGGTFRTDAGRNRCWRPEGPPPKPVSSGCFIARWRFHTALGKARIYLMTRSFEGNLAREEPSGLVYLDELNPRVLSNNLLIPYILATWEEYFRSTFSACLKYADRRDAVLKRSKLTHEQLEQVALSKKPIEQTIAECFSFQRPSMISETFRLLDSKLDLAGALRKPYHGRKVTLYDSIESLVEGRNAFVHAGKMDLSLYDGNFEKILTDIVEGADRAYAEIGGRFSFSPIHDY